MAAVGRWRETWNGSALWLEQWADSFSIGTAALTVRGLADVDGPAGGGNALTAWINKSIGSGTMDARALGHLDATISPIVAGIYPFQASQFNVFGRTTITGNLDFEEPYYVDPPMLLPTKAMTTVSGNLTAGVNKSIGAGTMAVRARAAFPNPVTITSFVAVVKPLFNVTLNARGLVKPTGDIATTSVKSIGSGTMAIRARGALTQTGFAIAAPPPYTHALGDTTLDAVGGLTLVGDPTWIDIPAIDLGALTLGLRGLTTVSTPRLFAGGLFGIEPVTLNAVARVTVRTNISYPGEVYPDTEAVAIYEGLDMQADLEDGNVTTT